MEQIRKLYGSAGYDLYQALENHIKRLDPKFRLFFDESEDEFYFSTTLPLEVVKKVISSTRNYFYQFRSLPGTRAKLIPTPNS